MVVMDISHANQQEFDSYTQITIETQTLCTQYFGKVPHVQFCLCIHPNNNHKRVKYVVYIDGNLFSIDGILALNINLERRVDCTCVVHNLIA